MTERDVSKRLDVDVVYVQSQALFVTVGLAKVGSVHGHHLYAATSMQHMRAHSSSSNPTAPKSKMAMVNGHSSR